MSTLDQAFVKAFARNRQPQSGDRAATDRSAEMTKTAVEVTKSTAAGRQTESDHKPNGSLVVDPSVAGSAIVWIDEHEGQQMRADMAASPTVPRPQIADRPETLTAPDAPGGVEEAAAFPPQTFRVDPAHPEPASDPRHLRKRDVPANATDNRNGADAERGTPPGDVSAELPDDKVPGAEVSGDKVPGGDVPGGVGQAPGHLDDALESSGDPASDKSGTTRESAAAAFPAVWEVDHFDMPAIVTDLFLGGFVADDLAQRMSTAVDQGLRSVLVSSVRPGEGRSTVAIGIAMSIAAVGYRVALVDADGANPTLADDLRLDIEYGWVDAQRGGLPIEEVAVRSLGDGVTLIPLMPPNGDTSATADEISELIEPLKRCFDLVVIDGPAGASPVSTGTRAFDTTLVVRDVTSTDGAEIEELSKQLRGRGVQGVGVIENFG